MLTEDEWLTCSDPLRMLDWLGARASRRKRQLCALACFERARAALDARPPWTTTVPALQLLQSLPEDKDWMEDYSEQEEAFRDVESTLSRRFWELGTETGAFCKDEDLWEAVRTGTEAGLTDWNDSEAVEAGVTCLVAAELVYDGYLHSLYGLYPDFPARLLAVRFASYAARSGAEPLRVWDARMRLLADLVRDVFGHLIGHVEFFPDWLSAKDATVMKIAGSVHDEQAFDQLPILADALEDAGCSEARVLSHLRSTQTHVRGCWVVDALLGKN